MDKLFIYGSVNAIPLYNCRFSYFSTPIFVAIFSERSPEEWSMETGMQRPITGCLQMAYGVIIDLLNLLIIFILSEDACFKLSCFKIMLLLAIIDFLIIPLNSILTGFLSIKGAVFCSYPTLIYISGSFELALWCSSCFTALILVCNRLLIMKKPCLETSIFNGERSLFILSIPVLYGCYFLFIPPLLFNSKYGAWFFDPMISPNRTSEYHNTAHEVNNILIVALTCVFYIPFQSIVRSNLRHVDGQSRFNQAKLQVLFQSILISVANQTSAIIYVVMNMVPVPPYIIIFGHYLWEFIHGAPVFIYLFLNHTIQKRFLEIIRFWKNDPENSAATLNTDLQKRETLNL